MMRRYNLGLGLSVFLALLIGVWASLPAPGSERHGLRAVVEDVATDVKRATVWRWTAYRELAQKRIVSTHEAAVLSKRVWRVSDGEMQFRGPHWLMAWRRKPVNARSMASEADTTPPFPGAYRGGGMALDHPSESCTDSVMAGSWPQNKWFVDVVGADTTGGSFSAAIDSAAANLDGCNYIHFRTGGSITQMNVGGTNAPQLENLYVAGQTAPGGGVQFHNTAYRMRSNALPGSHDLVFRYLTFRSLQGVSALGIFRGGVNRVMYDHLTSAWNNDFGGSHLLDFACDTAQSGSPSDGTCGNVTMQNNMVYEPHEGHATAMGGGGSPKDQDPSSNFFFYRNFYIGPGWRHPSVGYGEGYVIQENVEYNRWGQSEPAMWIHRYATNDIIQHYMKAGPATATNTDNRKGAVSWFSDNYSCPGAGVDNCGNDGVKDPPSTDTTTYVSGLRCEMNGHELNANPDSLWSGSKQCIFERGADEVPSQYRRFTPLGLPGPDPGVTDMTDSLRDVVVDSAGNIHRVNSQGAFEVRMADPDSARKNWFHNNLGPSNGINKDTMPIPTLAAGTAPTDSDSDGMPDAFESFYSVTNPTGDPDADRYTNYREFLNGTDPTTSDADGGGGGGGTFTATFGNGVSVYAVPKDTVVRQRIVGGQLVTDTTLTRPSGFGAGAPFVGWIENTAGDSMLIVTEDETGPTPLDSASAEGYIGSWSLCDRYDLCGISDLRGLSVPPVSLGVPTGDRWARHERGLREAA